MPVKRDFAFVVDDSVEAERLVKAVRGAEGIDQRCRGVRRVLRRRDRRR